VIAAISGALGRRRLRRWLVVLSVIGVVNALIGAGTLSAFSGSTGNASDVVTAGTVTIGTNAGSAILSMAGGRPGSTATGCIKVTFTGSLPSTVRLYQTLSGTLAPYLTMTVTRGSYDSTCSSFTADATNYIGAGAGVIYSGLLSGFPTTYGAGLVDPTAGSPETWTTGEVHAYRFVVTLNDDDNAQGLSSSATFTWEARNT
jgi:hypothetical protein